MAEPVARQATETGATGWQQTLAPAARFILQGGPAAREAAGIAFGVPLPDQPCQANTLDGRSALWLGPDEWLLLAPAAEAESMAAGLDAALADVAHSRVDVSHRQVTLQLCGPYAAAILNSGCPLDLDPAAFPPGMCTRTLFGKAAIVLWRTGATEFRIEVWRSFTAYVLGYLAQSAPDFIPPPG